MILLGCHAPGFGFGGFEELEPRWKCRGYLGRSLVSRATMCLLAA